MVAKIPSPTSVSGPESLRPNAPAAVADMSGLTRGVENLAASFNDVVDQQRKRQDTIDFARADAFATKSYLDMENQFSEDGDYATFDQRAKAGADDISAKAAAMIRNPVAREVFAADMEKRKVLQIDAINDRGRNLANEAERVSFGQALQTNADLITDPSTPESVRQKALSDIGGTITVGRETGLLTPAEAEKARVQYIDQAQEQLALNRGDQYLRDDPQFLLENTGIGPTGNPIDDARTKVRLPIIATPGTNLADVDAGVLNRFEQLQSSFGKQVTVISGARDAEHNAAVGGAKGSMHIEDKAIDLDMGGMSNEEKAKFIAMASSMGFTGIGVYKDSLHLDVGARRGWGPSYHKESIPAWAKDVMAQHMAGTIAEVPPETRGVAPELAALNYQQRAQLFDQAKASVDRGNMQLRGGIDLAVQNAPSAIARSGDYSGDTPDANAFVQAYGASEGIERFKQFDAAVTTAHDTFAMRTMSEDDIAAMVEKATPTSTGNDAALQEESYNRIVTAAQATIKARNDDPAGYVTETFPNVAEAWSAVEKDPAQYQHAVTVMADAQTMLGVAAPQLLPKTMANNAAASFNNAELPQDQRVGALTQLVMGTTDPQQQSAIYAQLVKSGVPEYTRGAMAALERGDSAAAQRLFTAAMTDTSKLPGKLPNTDAQINEAIQSTLLDKNGIGDVAYGLTDGSAENYANAQVDAALIEKSVKLRLLDGSAGGNLQTAIDMTQKDLFGDVRVETGTSWGGKAGMKILLPKNEDRGPYQAGFDALLGQVGQALKADMDQSAEMAGLSTANGSSQITDAAIAQQVKNSLAQGYFTGNGDGVFHFIDPLGTVVPGADGKPLSFSKAQVMLAAQKNQGQSFIERDGQMNPDAQDPTPNLDFGL